MEKSKRIVLAIFILAIIPNLAWAQYERNIDFQIVFNKSAFSDAQLRMEGESSSFNPLTWIAYNSVLSSAYGGEEFIESAGGAYPPQLEKYFDEVDRRGLLTVIMFDSRGNVVDENQISVDFNGHRTRMSRVVNPNEFGSITESVSERNDEEMIREEKSEMMFTVESSGGMEYLFSSLEEAKREATEIGRRKATETRFAGNAGNAGNASVMVIMFTPDSRDFGARVSPSIITIYPSQRM
jgi:hypothetical protein